MSQPLSVTETFTINALAQFRAVVMADDALADALNRIQIPDLFARSAAEIAAAHGIALEARTILTQIQPDPLGLARWQPAPLSGPFWPPNHWLPIAFNTLDGQAFIDWAYFGADPLNDPFFEGSIRRALSLPFNRMFRYRTAFADFARGAAQEQSLPPNGFIFHMSRCGSTLVSQMLAALPQNIAISEAAPIDTVVQLSRAWPSMPAEQHGKFLAAMIAAFGRKRSGSERHYFIKLDSWHTMALPLFRRAFPKTLWVFLYRDPVEVMVSQTRQRGMQMVPEVLPPELYDIGDADGLAIDEYSARVLAKLCEAAADNVAQGGGLLVNYRELPDAVFTKILPHFGVACSAHEREIMRRAAQYDAKAPGFEFASDAEGKQQEASEMIRTLAGRHLGGVYRRLENISGERLV